MCVGGGPSAWVKEEGRGPSVGPSKRRVAPRQRGVPWAGYSAWAGLGSVFPPVSGCQGELPACAKIANGGRGPSGGHPLHRGRIDVGRCGIVRKHAHEERMHIWHVRPCAATAPAIVVGAASSPIKSNSKRHTTRLIRRCLGIMIAILESIAALDRGLT